jgi:hypothetical protein
MVLSDDDLIRLQRKKKEHVDLQQLMMVMMMMMRLSMLSVISMQIVVVDETVVLQVVFAVHDKVTPAVAAVDAVSAADKVCAFACHLFRF